MHSVSRDIDAPAHIAWRLLIDTAEWPGWGPSVRAVEAPQRRIGPGMRGRIQTPPGLWFPFEITAWQPGEAWAWRVAAVEATGHRVEPLGAGRCRVSFLIPRWAPLYRPICASALRKIADLAEAGGHRLISDSAEGDRRLWRSSPLRPRRCTAELLNP